jgi:hypothetical protein
LTETCNQFADRSAFAPYGQSYNLPVFVGSAEWQLIRGIGAATSVQKMFAPGGGWPVSTCVLEQITHIRPMPKPKAREIIGHARDALLIFVIVLAGMYVLDHPEKVDTFLNWLLRRH